MNERCVSTDQVEMISPQRHSAAEPQPNREQMRRHGDAETQKRGDAEAAVLQMRADLMADLRKFIKARKLTQAKAAQILGVSQSRVSDDQSDLIRGKWERFSLEMLITLATRAGMEITLSTAA